jgi:hypothetical protein
MWNSAKSGLTIITRSAAFGYKIPIEENSEGVQQSIK